MDRLVFNETHELFRDTVQTFISREVVPHAEKWEDAGLVDKDLYLRAGECGLLGMSVPAAFGGGDVDDFRFNAIIAEEFCRAGMLNAGQGIITHNDVVVPYFLSLCTAEQR